MNKRSPEFPLSIQAAFGLLAVASMVSACTRQASRQPVPTSPYHPTAAARLAAETPTSTATETLIPTATPTNTPTLTRTPVPPTLTEAPTATWTPFPTGTPASANCEISNFEACRPNFFADNEDGAAKADFSRLETWLEYWFDQSNRYGPAAGRLDYAADMLVTPPLKDNNGDIILPWQTGPDFWEKFGGLGFTPDNYNGHDGVPAALSVAPDEFFRPGKDGFHRAIVGIGEEADFEFALAAAVRAKLKLLNPDRDFTTPAVLKEFNTEIQAEVAAVISAAGFRPKTQQPWPGAEEIFGDNSSVKSFVDGAGRVCVGFRPPASSRRQQVPERFRPVDYIEELETTTDGDDETLSRLDTGNSLIAVFVLDKKTGRLRVDIFSLASPLDALRPGQALKDKDRGEVDTEIGRWVTCAAVAPTPMLPSATPEFRPSPPPAATPRLTETPPQKPTPTLRPSPPATARSSPSAIPPTATERVATPTPRPSPTGAPTQPPQPTATEGIPSETPYPPTPTPAATAWQTPIPSPEVTPTPFGSASTRSELAGFGLSSWLSMVQSILGWPGGVR